VRENIVTALVDADAGLGHPASVFAMELAMAKAKIAGVGVVTVRNSHHFGAAGYYAAMAPREGLIGFVTSATRTISVVPTRGAGHQPHCLRRTCRAQPRFPAGYGNQHHRRK
jgi:LDH2 family malate/lactate/ureidoglycolate dehydrogenase